MLMMTTCLILHGHAEPQAQGGAAARADGGVGVEVEVSSEGVEASVGDGSGRTFGGAGREGTGEIGVERGAGSDPGCWAGLDETVGEARDVEAAITCGVAIADEVGGAAPSAGCPTPHPNKVNSSRKLRATVIINNVLLRHIFSFCCKSFFDQLLYSTRNCR